MIEEKIKEYCDKNHLSIHGFEQLCGLGNGTIHKWKKGKANPSVSSLNKIQKATGISIAWFLG